MSALASIATTTVLSLAGSAIVVAAIAGCTGGLAPIIAASLSWSALPESTGVQPLPPAIPLDANMDLEPDQVSVDLSAELVPTPEADHPLA